MAVFAVEAIDASGKKTKREIEATDKNEALQKVRTLGLRPTRLQEKRGAIAAAAGGAEETKSGFRLFKGVRRTEITQFTTQLATLQDAGLPIVRSLRILCEQMKPGTFREQVTAVTDEVEGGSSFSEALRKYPRSFDTLYVAMVRAGEAGGVLDVILQRLSYFQEKSLKLAKKVKGAMIYPIVVTIVATGILSVIMIKVIPEFEKMFKDMGSRLPVPTQILLNFSQTVRDFWYLIPLIPFLLYVLFQWLKRTDRGSYALDKFKMTMPIFGQIVKKSTISRFCRTLGTLIASGVPILEALTIVRDAVANRVIADAIENVHGSIREGETIAEPLKQSKVFDAMLVNMINIGEETGELDKMLNKIADNYDLDVDVLVESLSSLLEPVLIVGMGIAVGFIVIALFMPLLSIIEKIG